MGKIFASRMLRFGQQLVITYFKLSVIVWTWYIQLSYIALHLEILLNVSFDLGLYKLSSVLMNDLSSRLPDTQCRLRKDWAHCWFARRVFS